LPTHGNRGAFTGMGAKYLPTKKDLKASQRYFENKHPLPHTRKSATTLPKVKPVPGTAAKPDASGSSSSSASS
jgi:hypothetical protein